MELLLLLQACSECVSWMAVAAPFSTHRAHCVRPPKRRAALGGKKIGQLVPLKSVLHLKLAEAVSSHIRKSSILRLAHGRRAQKVQRWPGVVFVMGAFAEMSGDVSRICVTIARELARTSASHYNDHAKQSKGMYISSPGGTRRTAVGSSTLLRRGGREVGGEGGGAEKMMDLFSA